MLNGWRPNRRSAPELERLGKELREAKHRIDSLERELLARTLAAESTAKELGSLTYGISHDLRAPLRAIEGFARILEEDFAPAIAAEGRGHLQVIRDAARKMDRLIEGMLALARVSTQALAPDEVDMTQLAKKAADEVRHKRNAGSVPLVLGQLPPARGDSVLLQQVWLHLIDNAYKFSSNQSEPNIEIGARQEATGPVYYVKDNGAGFDMRYASKLFNVFQRLHTEKEFPGVGVGLAIVNRIVSRHGGRVWAEGERDKGACFYFALSRDGGET